jgi:hypothetical protein
LCKRFVNNWDRDSLPFRHTRAGNWEIEVEMDQGREYRFRYLLDEVHWRYDWHADKHAPNSKGVSTPSSWPVTLTPLVNGL